MTRSVGKVFEDQWKKSCPSNILIYKPPDAAQSFYMNEKLRFGSKSPCDYMMFDGEIFYTLELKTFNGSCSFERCKEEKGIIHYHQIESLKKFYTYKNVCSGFILDFREIGNTYFLNIGEWDGLISSINKKSFNENDLLNYCSPILIDKTKLKVNYKYDIRSFMNEVKKRNMFNNNSKESL